MDEKLVFGTVAFVVMIILVSLFAIPESTPEEDNAFVSDEDVSNLDGVSSTNIVQANETLPVSGMNNFKLVSGKNVIAGFDFYNPEFEACESTGVTMILECSSLNVSTTTTPQPVDIGDRSFIEVSLYTQGEAGTYRCDTIVSCDQTIVDSITQFVKVTK